MCLAIKKKLGLSEIDSDHFPGKCPRKNLTVSKIMVEDDLDAPVLVSVGPVAGDVALDAREHLAELPCDALLAMLDDS